MTVDHMSKTFRARVALQLVAEYCFFDAHAKGVLLHAAYREASSEILKCRRTCLAANKWAIEALDERWVPQSMNTLLFGERSDISKDETRLLKLQVALEQQSPLDTAAHAKFERHLRQSAWSLARSRIVTLLKHRKTSLAAPNAPRKPLQVALLKTLPALAGLVVQVTSSLGEVDELNVSLELLELVEEI